MPKKVKTPEFSDWHVTFLPDASGLAPAPRTVRASSALVIEGWLYLRDTWGGILFGAPSGSVHHFRRLEPGEDVPAAKEEPKAAEVPADPGPIAAGPAPRPRTTRRAK
jgi:hypothetical protein